MGCPVTGVPIPLSNFLPRSGHWAVFEEPEGEPAGGAGDYLDGLFRYVCSAARQPTVLLPLPLRGEAALVSTSAPTTTSLAPA